MKHPYQMQIAELRKVSINNTQSCIVRLQFQYGKTPSLSSQIMALLPCKEWPMSNKRPVQKLTVANSVQPCHQNVFYLGLDLGHETDRKLNDMDAWQ